jgi:hypothetical protein
MINPIFKVKTGYRSTLPKEAERGLTFVTLDTGKLYIGQGLGKGLVKIGVRTKYNFSGIAQILTFIRGTSVQSLPVGCSKIMISSNIDCNIAWGPSPVATATSTAIQSRQPYILTVGAGNKIAILPITLTTIPTTYFYMNELL